MNTPAMEGGLTPDPHAGLPQTLGHAYETFEAIRQLARRCEDQSPDLFAAFMSAAVTAADGRNAILTANTEPTATPQAAAPAQPAPSPDPHETADSIAASAAALATRLNHAAGLALTSRDRQACHDAAAAARRIHQLLTADDSHAR